MTQAIASLTYHETAIYYETTSMLFIVYFAAKKDGRELSKKVRRYAANEPSELALMGEEVAWWNACL